MRSYNGIMKMSVDMLESILGMSTINAEWLINTYNIDKVLCDKLFVIPQTNKFEVYVYFNNMLYFCELRTGRVYTVENNKVEFFEEYSFRNPVLEAIRKELLKYESEEYDDEEDELY